MMTTHFLIKTNITVPPLHHHPTTIFYSALEDGYFDPAKISNALIEDGKYYAMSAPNKKVLLDAAKVAQ